MTSRFSLAARALLLAGLLLILGCTLPHTPNGFNNDMARANFEMAEAAKELREALYPSPNYPLPRPTVRGAQSSMTKALANAREMFENGGRYRSGLAPAHSTNGAVMLERYKEFLAVQQTILDKHVAKIVEVYENIRLDPGTKGTLIAAEIQTIGAEEAKAMAALKEVKELFYKEHNLQGEAPKLQ